MSAFLQLLRSNLVLGDGAIGTLLYQRGQPLNACYDALNLQQPERICQLHQDYLRAGARLLETNTFGANRIKLDRFGLAQQVHPINKKGAELAAQIARPAGAFVAGSVGPLSANPSEALDLGTQQKSYREQMEGLYAGGVDLLFLETFARLSELLIALQVAKEIGPLPVIASLSFSDDGHTADGVRITEAFSRLRGAGADVAGLNCHSGPMGTEKILSELAIAPGDLVSAYPNAGRPQYYDGRYIYHPTPKYFADYLPKLVAQGARLIGGCCGTTPETIAAMAEALPSLKPINSKAPVLVVAPAMGGVGPSAPISSKLLSQFKRGTLIVTELDPPKNLNLDKLFEGARCLKEAGTDFITLADNSLAILRVSNVATAHLIQQKVGLEPIIHLACRDRNLLGTQSELMGLYALGIHHVLALTGDPAKLGDHPGASSVYDLNSIGLIKTIKRLNEGFAANGRDLKAKTEFVIGCAFNPNSRNLDSQVRKLEDKIKAGADFVMTQPIFDPPLAKMTYERTKAFGIPVLLGVMPLLNGRNAEFLHNEVPGIVIPDPVRERLRGKEGPQGIEEGLALARELCDAVLEYFSGIYLITPLMRYDLTARLSQHVRQRAPFGR